MLELLCAQRAFQFPTAKADINLELPSIRIDNTSETREIECLTMRHWQLVVLECMPTVRLYFCYL